MAYKHQHTVPKGYLNGFATPELLIHQFDKKPGEQDVRQISTKDAAVRRNFYTLKTVPPEQKADYEKYLSSNIEGPGIAVIKTLRDGGMIDVAEKATLGRYLGTQFTRVPRFKTRLDDQWKDRMAGYRARQPERYRRLGKQFFPDMDPDALEWLNAQLIQSTADMEQSDIYKAAHHDSTLHSMRDIGEDLGAHLSSFAWIVVHLPSTMEMITSDNPMQLWSGPNNEPPMQFIPLATDCVLILAPGDSNSVEHEPPEKADKGFIDALIGVIAGTAERFIYAESEDAMKPWVDVKNKN